MTDRQPPTRALEVEIVTSPASALTEYDRLGRHSQRGEIAYMSDPPTNHGQSAEVGVRDVVKTPCRFLAPEIPRETLHVDGLVPSIHRGQLERLGRTVIDGACAFIGVFHRLEYVDVHGQ